MLQSRKTRSRKNLKLVSMKNKQKKEPKKKKRVAHNKGKKAYMSYE
mgnify:CR=1 FL=1